MKIILPVITVILLVSAGCASSLRNDLTSSREETRELQSKLVKLTNQVQEQQQAINNISKQLEDAQFEITILRKKIVDINEPAVQETNAKIDAILNELKEGKSVPEELAQRLRPYGKQAVIALGIKLKDPDLKCRDKAQKVLCHLDAKNVIPLLRPGLTDPDIRIPVTQVLSSLNDRSVIPLLAEYLGNENEEFIFAIAEGLIKLRDKRGVPAMIEFLKHRDDNLRALSFDVLFKATGLTFDYKHYESEKNRKTAVEKWEEWWLKNGATFEFMQLR